MKRIVVITCALAWLGISQGRTEDPKAVGEVLPPCCKELSGESALGEASIYQLKSEWVSDWGRRVPLRVFRGKPQVVAMFFASCEFACPILVADMKRLEATLTEEERRKVEFLLISFDTERDRPEALRRYRERMGLGVKNWSLITGQEKGVREVAAVLGIQYRKDARGQYAHTNKLILLDAEGEVVGESVGLGQSLEGLIERLRKLWAVEETLQDAD